LGWMIWLMRQQTLNGGSVPRSMSNPFMAIAILCAIQIALGVIHIWFVVPAWTQVAHVVVGSALITYIFAVYLASGVKSTQIA